MLNIKQMRIDKNMSQRELAARSGVSVQMVSMVETGHRRPSVPTAQKIASVLGFDWTEFFEEEESA